MKYVFPVLICCLVSCHLFVDKKSGWLIGEWQLVQAFRNERVTESLDNLYMEFLTTGQVKTNILGMDELYEYQYQGGEITQNAPGIGQIVYKITAMTDTTLELTTSLKNFNFRFLMKKGE
jgi:hypothetical protein